MRRVVAMAALALLCLSAEAVAQRRTSGMGVTIYGGAGAVAPDASKSVEAVSGQTTIDSWTVGGRVTNVWRHVFVDLAVSQQAFDGERVFLHNGTVYGLGIPLRVTMSPRDAALGWRFGDTNSRILPYAALGASQVGYKETADFATSGDNVTGTATGLLVMAGADIRVWKWVAAGADVRYRKVTGVLGESGISQDYAEDQLGGTAVTFRLVIGR